MTPDGSQEESILRDALGRPPSGRRAFLDSACAGNDALRRRLEELMAAHGADTQAPTIKVKPDDDLLDESVGQTLGGYKLLEKIGEGGYGVVYVAEQTEPVRRRVALKVIKLGMDTREVVARFETERQALAMMDHPNIAKVFDGGATVAGRPYFVMELVRGIPITQHCDDNKLSTEDRLALFTQVCQAIEHAHQKGIIHRDIKPSNILVTFNDGVSVAKVIDFGIAKATQGALTDKTVYTQLHQFLGTPAYMSPEQAEMNAQDIDTRSDIYSLGVLLYELLVGRTPFDAKELLQAGLDAMRRTIREREPQRPSTRLGAMPRDEQTTTARRRAAEARKLVSLLRGDLDWIVMKCLEKDRARRYETASGLAMDVRRHVQNEPVLARPPSRAYRARKLIRRNRLAFALIALAAGALVFTAWFSAWQAVKARRAERHSAQVAKFLQEMLQGAGPSVARGRDTTLLREILDTTSKRVETELRSDPQVELDLKDTIGAVYVELGDYTNAEAIFRANLATRRKLYGDRYADTASALGNLGIILSTQNKFTEAEAAIRESLGLRTNLLGKEHPDIAASLNSLGTLLFNQGRLPEAEVSLRKALAMRTNLFGAEHADVAETLNDLSLVLKDEGRLAEAEDMQRKALAMTRKLLGADHPNVGNSLNNLAAILSARGKMAEAEAMQREELALSTKLLGADHPNIAVSLNNLALCLRDEQKLAEAETVARQALAIRKKAFDADNPDIAVSLANLASILLPEGKLAEAESNDREALALRRRVLANDDPDLADSLDDLAAVLADEDKLTEADQLSRECVGIREKAFPESWRTFSAKSRLGGILMQEKRSAEAESLLLSGYAGMKQRMDKIAAEDRPRLIAAIQRLVTFYSSTSQAEKTAAWKRELEMQRTNSGGNGSR